MSDKRAIEDEALDEAARTWLAISLAELARIVGESIGAPA